MILDIVLLCLMILAALWTVSSRSLLKAAMGLAVVSLIITILMYRYDAPLSAVFELSVCTGLITVIFLSTIGLTKPMSHEEINTMSKDKIKRYVYLPFIVIVVGLLSLGLWNLPVAFKSVAGPAGTDVREVLWNFRQMDLLGQIIILLAGSFGAVILFKERGTDDW